MKRLIIAEKPSVARAIAESLGIENSKEKGQIICHNDTVLTWCLGHLLQLADAEAYLSRTPDTEDGKIFWRMEDIPIYPAEWKYIIKDDTKKQFNRVSRLIGEAEEIVNAGDPDNEGQRLVDEVIEYNKFKGKVLRYWANAVDSKTVKTALENLKDNSEYHVLGEIAKVRAESDWLLGINLTRAYTLKWHNLTVIGRVKTPTLQLVATRDLEIKNFVPKDYFSIKAKIKVQAGSFDAKYQVDESLDGVDDEGRVVSRALADKIWNDVKNTTTTDYEIEDKMKSVPVPLGLSLSDIQQLANKLHGYTADTTLAICQQLYEMKLTTYPRTDCKYLPTAQYSEAETVLKNIANCSDDLAELAKKADSTLKSRIWNDEKTTAHHAIVPTSEEFSIESLTEIQTNIFKLIVRSYVAQFYPEHKYLESVLTATFNGNKFTAKCKEISAMGWKSVYSTGDDEEDNSQKLPEIQENESLLAEDVIVEALKTKPPKPYTEGTLIKAMENIHKYVDDPEIKATLKDGDGIGTSATRANIIRELKNYHLLYTKDKYIRCTEPAFACLENITKDLTSPVRTALNERDFLAIEKGELSQEDFIEKIKDFCSGEISKCKSNVQPYKTKNVETELKCPICGKAVSVSKYYYSCEDENCWKTRITIAGVSLNQEDLKKIFAGKSPVYKMVNKEGKKFEAMLAVDLEKKQLKFVFESAKPSEEHKCPICGNCLIRIKSKKDGTPWWVCTGQKTCNCNFFAGDKDGKPAYFKNYEARFTCDKDKAEKKD